jgi:hypothetical protein
VSAPLRGAKRAPRTAAGKPGADGTLFSHEVRRDGKPVAVLRGMVADGVVTVETDIHPVGRPPGEPPDQRPFVFTSVDAAQRFADECLTAFEYLDCEIVGS